MDKLSPKYFASKCASLFSLTPDQEKQLVDMIILRDADLEAKFIYSEEDRDTILPPST